jgi:hypothetical protein
MNPKKPQPSSQSTTTRLVCPKCGGEVVAQLMFGSNFCGARAVASCKSGCQWTPEEQQEINCAATDEMFG